MPASLSAIFRVIPAALVIIAATRAGGALLSRARQPSVIGELLMGILLGPSLVGRLLPGVERALFPAEVMPALNLLAQIGVVLFMFLVGLELDGELLRRHLRTAIVIANASVIVPFVLGAALALAVYPWLAGDAASRTVFALFVGVAFSVTAFPVLVRILTDLRQQRTAIGTLAISCAAAGDVTAWCLLAVVTGLARAAGGSGWMTLLFAALFAGTTFTLVRPAVVRLVTRMTPARSIGPLAAGLAVYAVAADRIGLHAIFGAFLFGAIVPARSRVGALIEARVTTTVGFLLPVFFALTGLRMQVSLIDTRAEWAMALVIVLMASAGKLGGAWGAAKLVGLPARDALVIGALMNTRGLVELVVVTVGLDLRVISPTLFAMLVLMALITTATTTPVLALLGWRPARPQP